MDSGTGDHPHLQPEIGFSDASEREAVRAQEIPVDAGASPEPNALSAAEPAAVIDWLAVLDTP